jgi:hypothetical protein
MSTNTLINGRRIEVAYRNGQKETIEFKELSIRQLYRFIDAVERDQTPELVALCAGKPIEWIDALTLASFGKLAKYCIAENFPKAMELSGSDSIANSKMFPLLHKISLALAGLTPEEKAELAKELKKEGAIAGASNNSSPAPASSESRAEPGSASST